MKKFTKTSFLLILMLSVTGILATAQTLPRLDNTFGTGGVIRPSFGGNPKGFKHITPMPDGGAWVTGFVKKRPGQNYRNEMLVMRLKQDGSLDTTLLGQGFDYSAYWSTVDNWGGMTLPHPDGGVVCIGSCLYPTGAFSIDDSTFAFVYKMLPNGRQLDRTNWLPSTGFIKILGTGKTSHPTAAQILSNGKILIGLGGHEVDDCNSNVFQDKNFKFSLAQLTANGVMDATFGSNGVAKYSAPNANASNEHFLTGMAVQPDGKIVVCGYFMTGSSAFLFNKVPKYFLSRLNSSGSLDLSFGTNGFATAALTNYDTLAPSGVLIEPSGKIIMYSTAQARMLHLAKFNANGTLDLTFNGGMGYRTISSPHKFVARSGLLQNDGKIVMASMGTPIRNLTKGIYINRFMANGDDDLSFGVNGEFSLLTNDSLKLSHIAFSNDLTKIILAGFVQKLEPAWGIMEIKEGFMMRLMTDTNIGVVDVEDKQASILVFPNPTTERLILNYTLQSETEVAISLRSLDGKVLQTYETMSPSKAGENKLDLTLPASLASGSYFLTLSTKMGIKSILITKI